MPCAKINSLDDLTGQLAYLRRHGQRIVLCAGCWDLLHIDHIRHLQEARKSGDVLVVAVTADRFVNKGPGRPAFPAALRAEAVAALACVDHVFINEHPSAVEAIRLLRPNVFAKGSECKSDPSGNFAAEEAAVKEIGGRMLFTASGPASSSAILNRHLPTVPEAAQKWLAGFRHTAAEVNAALDATASLSVVVVGETIIDEYVWVKTIGKSGKEPCLVAEELERETHDGGVLAVRKHVEYFVPVVAQLTGGDKIIKTRFVERYPMQKSYEVYRNLGRQFVSSMAGNFSLAIVADYGHGASEEVLTNASFLAVNVQNNAGNFGYNTHEKYGRIDYLCLSENELRLAARQRNGDLRQLIEKAATLHGCKYVTVTRGDKGVLCWSAGAGFVECPAFSDHFTDRVGAGDAVLAVTSLLACQGVPVDVLAFVANCVGALAVQIVGNRTSVSKVALQKFIVALLK